jgi:hypothetical protein
LRKLGDIGSLEELIVKQHGFQTLAHAPFDTAALSRAQQPEDDLRFLTLAVTRMAVCAQRATAPR